MCGISGWYLREGAARSDAGLRAMAALLEHRGPDDRGFHYDPRHGIGLAHNRLSILDLTDRGHQPMHGNRPVVLNYNGEIYNFRELRNELASLGHSFVSDCDTEVVLRAYEEWEEGCVERLHGMFAFAIWSPEEEKLFLARDGMGIKPLYYTELQDHGFFFASEVKAFLGIDDFAPRMNRSAMEQFLEFGFTYDEHETSLRGVRKLPPGHVMTVRRGEVRELRRYYSPPAVQPDGRTLDQRADELFETLSTVVAQHLIADVPVALLLSGGIDSSVIAAIAARRTMLRTFTMAFADSAVDERKQARLVSDHIGSQHQEVVIGASELPDTLDDAVWSVDDLFGDWGVVSTRLLYQKARDAGIKVVLVGEGADEIFGGYPHFQEFAGENPSIANFFRLYRRYAGRRYGRGLARFLATIRRCRGEDFFQTIRLFETRHQLPNNYLMKVDKASMSASVEARVPYLDRRVAELAFRAPTEFLMNGTTDKLLLRRMAERHKLLPPEIVSRPKFGGSIAASWMDESPKFRQYARDVILGRDGWTDELNLRDAMTRFFDRGETGYRFPRSISIFRNLAWRLLLLNLWSRQYLDASRPRHIVNGQGV